MEKKLNQKVESYMSGFKQSLYSYLDETGKYQRENIQEILQFIEHYETLSFTKEDLIKRKRVKNIVPFCDRCTAKRANEERCTRRKREGIAFCGTHSKIQPHGVIDEEEVKPTYKIVQVRTVDIQGIIYYIDDDGHVYEPNDIIDNVKNPRVIATYIHNKEDNTYTIPELH
jgi:hypothetical protein